MRSLLLLAAITTAASDAGVEGNGATYGIGRPATDVEVRARDISIAPSGRGLPTGRGTALVGKPLYVSRCASCHGPLGEAPDEEYPKLVGGQGTLATAKPILTVGSYWPYATTAFDYIRRAMPYDAPGTLSADEVYSITAYVLFLNGIVAESQELDAASLPNVLMPNRDGFVSDPRPLTP